MIPEPVQLASGQQPEERYLDTIEGKCEVGTPDPEFDLAGRGTWTVRDGERVRVDIDQALVVSSAKSGATAVGKEPTHRPVLDIDIPARLVPSTTPGHHHLYLDIDVPWEQYEVLLKALAGARIIEAGYLLAALERKATFARLPWVKKKSEEIA